MMSDIVKRLRATAEIAKNLGVEGGLSETAADEIERLRERLAEADEANRKVSDANENLRAALEPLPPIEQDEMDPSREYIPLPGGWEIQTKGRGSSYRLCDTKSKERHTILVGEPAFVQDFVTRMAKEIHAAKAALKETGND
jgi:hypothetical protein